MADSATVQILKDTAEALIVKLTMEQADGTPEAHVEKINVATLSCLTYLLNFDGNVASVGQNGFIPGERINGANSNAEAVVVRYQPESNTLYVVNLTGNSTFANGEVVTGRMSNSHVTLAVANTQVAPARSLDFESIWFSVAESGRLSLEWEGLIAQNSNVANTNAYFVTAATLFESGYFGKNALAALFPQQTLAVNGSVTFTGNGSIAVSTLGLVANGGYTVVLEMRKGSGFSPIPDDRFKDK